ncbi:DUF664 domain-containing protein [Streptomyces fumanus]|uniref:mycothiol transferase n=1 Tax=Streptomyces fumanus TaxID=67302 RepID=UPI003F4CEA21
MFVVGEGGHGPRLPLPGGAYEHDTRGPDEAMAAWQTEVARGRALIAEASLDDSGRLSEQEARHVGDQGVSLRWIMVHMIEEYTRHNGHADLLRERIDGTTGT